MNPHLIVFWLSIAAGLTLIFWGRWIFWLFVAAVGFASGIHLAPLIAAGHPEWMTLAIALGLGIIGALLAVVLQRVAVAIAGAAAGALLASRLLCALGITAPMIFWITVILGAVIIAALVTVLFDWALVGLTTVMGALLVCDATLLAPSLEWALGLTLVFLGIWVQGYGLVNPPGSKT